jgi:hypothetical protein
MERDSDLWVKYGILAAVGVEVELPEQAMLGLYFLPLKLVLQWMIASLGLLNTC